MNTPLLSVVIPTHRRPQYLPRAIDSALQAAPDNDVEVIVVPNGENDLWKQVAVRYTHEPRVHWHPAAEGHANVARNHGKQRANGKYVRFLDDDDYLLPAAIKQLIRLESCRGEFCSGRVSNIDMDGADLGLVTFPSTKDFVIASTLTSGFTLPAGNLFLRDAIQPFWWDESAPRLQDNIWMFALAGGREWSWEHVEEPVAVWFQHDQTRVSSVQPDKHPPKHIMASLQKLANELEQSGRLTEDRRKAIAVSLWNYAHTFFPFQPFYWTGVAKLANSLSTNARPSHPFFSLNLLEVVHPLVIEWGMLPLRLLAKRYKAARKLAIGRDYRRRL